LDLRNLIRSSDQLNDIQVQSNDYMLDISLPGPEVTAISTTEYIDFANYLLMLSEIDYNQSTNLSNEFEQTEDMPILKKSSNMANLPIIIAGITGVLGIGTVLLKILNRLPLGNKNRYAIKLASSKILQKSYFDYNQAANDYTESLYTALVGTAYMKKFTELSAHANNMEITIDQLTAENRSLTIMQRHLGRGWQLVSELQAKVADLQTQLDIKKADIKRYRELKMVRDHSMQSTISFGVDIIKSKDAYLETIEKSYKTLAQKYQTSKASVTNLTKRMESYQSYVTSLQQQIRQRADNQIFGAVYDIEGNYQFVQQPSNFEIANDIQATKPQSIYTINDNFTRSQANVNKIDSTTQKDRVPFTIEPVIDVNLRRSIPVLSTGNTLKYTYGPVPSAYDTYSHQILKQATAQNPSSFNLIDILKGVGLGIAGSFTGFKRYHNLLSNSHDKLHWTINSLELDKIEASRYIKHLHLKAEMDSLVQSSLAKKLTAEIERVKQKNTDLEEHVAYLSSRHHTLLANHDEAVRKLTSKLNVMSTRMNELEIENLKSRNLLAFAHIKKDFNRFKEFLGHLVRVFRIVDKSEDPYRKTYGYNIHGAHPSTQEVVYFLDAYDHLYSMAGLENIHTAISASDFDDFVAKVQASSEIRNSALLKPSNKNIIAKLDMKDQHITYVDALNTFFSSNSIEIAIAAAITSAFIITGAAPSVLVMLKALTQYIIKNIIVTAKEMTSMKLRHVVVDGIFWALTEVYNQGSHQASELYKYIYAMAHKQSVSDIRKFDTRDSVITNAAIYITEFINGRIMPAQSKKLPFDLSYIDKIDAKFETMDQYVINLIDSVARKTKNMADIKKLGSKKTIAYNEIFNFVINDR